MTGTARIRVARAEDQRAIAVLAEASGLFPADALPDMIAPFLAGDQESLWLVAEGDGELAGFLYAEAEFLTVGTYNLRAMATREDGRRQGVGTSLIERCSEELARRQARLLLVETSSSDAFAATRLFYSRRGFREEARITGFWAPGDDKVIFWKSLSTSERLSGG